MDPTKTKIMASLTNHYGNRWKTALSRDLDVDRATIKRIFNQREKVPVVYQLAIKQITGE